MKVLFAEKCTGGNIKWNSGFVVDHSEPGKICLDLTVEGKCMKTAGKLRNASAYNGWK